MLDTAEGLKRIGSICFIMCSLFASSASLCLDCLIKKVESEYFMQYLILNRPTHQTCTLSKVMVKSKRLVC